MLFFSSEAILELQMSVRVSVNHVFSVHFPLIYEHQFFRYFVRRFISQATKGRNVKKCRNFHFHLSFFKIQRASLLMDAVILV